MSAYSAAQLNLLIAFDTWDENSAVARTKPPNTP
jgi:hypothetical protein